MAGHRQVISRINKGSQNIFIYNFIITTFDCQGNSQGKGISARPFALACSGVASPLTITRKKQESTSQLLGHINTLCHRS